MTDSPNMNAAQLAQIRQAAQNSLGHAIEQMQLRKWSMEQALGIFGSSNAPESAGLREMATLIYDFVAKPALEFKLDADK
jgi:hypothetical protein